jgi:predicted DNA-binding protein with PD1-like motif
MSERTESIASELLKLRDKGGKISASGAVEWAAKNKKSHLHAALEWDDAIAGAAHRVWQVRSLIAVHVLDAEGARRFVSLSIDRGEGGYRQISDVMSNADLRKIMIEDALGELQRMERKYKHLQELEVVWAARDRVARGSRTSVVRNAAD